MSYAPNRNTAVDFSGGVVEDGVTRILELPSRSSDCLDMGSVKSQIGPSVWGEEATVQVGLESLCRQSSPQTSGSFSANDTPGKDWNWYSGSLALFWPYRSPGSKYLFALALRSETARLR